MKKKIFTSLLLITMSAIFVLTGCSQGIQVPVINEPWLYLAPKIDIEGNNYEKLEYRVQINSGYEYSSLAGIDIYRLQGEGTYTSIIKWQGDKPTEYTIETSLSFKGTYVDKDKTYTSPEFQDIKTTKTVISSSKDNYFPKSSEKISKVSFVSQKDGKEQLEHLDYKETINYSSDKATATLYKYNPNTSKYDLPVPRSPQIADSAMRKTDYTFSGLENKVVFDNSAIFYMVRALDNFGTSTEFRQAFHIVNVEDNTLKETQFASVKSADNNIFDPISYAVNGQTITRHAAYGQLGYVGQKTGQPLNVWYSNSKLENSNKPKYLLKLQEGPLEYFLEKANDSFIQSEQIEQPKE